MRLKALDPRNFKDGGDVGTLAVRYVVQAQNEKNTILRIDAVFVEDFRHISHASNGSVEGAEYKDIHDRLEAIQLMKAQTAEAEREKQEAGSKTQPSSGLTDVPQSSSQPVRFGLRRYLATDYRPNASTAQSEHNRRKASDSGTAGSGSSPAG